MIIGSNFVKTPFSKCQVGSILFDVQIYNSSFAKCIFKHAFHIRNSHTFEVKIANNYEIDNWSNSINLVYNKVKPQLLSLITPISNNQVFGGVKVDLEIEGKYL